MTGPEPVGSTSEEAARLVDAAQQWWGRHAAPAAEPDRAPRDEQGQDHPSTCRSCPWCRARTLLAAVPPEAVDHLSAAATSLAAAVRELTRPGPPRAGPGPDPTGPGPTGPGPTGPADDPHQGLPGWA